MSGLIEVGCDLSDDLSLVVVVGPVKDLCGVFKYEADATHGKYSFQKIY